MVKTRTDENLSPSPVTQGQNYDVQGCAKEKTGG